MEIQVQIKPVTVAVERWTCPEGHTHQSPLAAQRCVDKLLKANNLYSQERAETMPRRVLMRKGLEMIRAGQEADEILVQLPVWTREYRLLHLELCWRGILDLFGFAGKLVAETPFGVTAGMSKTAEFRQVKGPFLSIALNHALRQCIARLIEAGITSLDALDALSDWELQSLTGSAASGIKVWRYWTLNGDKPDLALQMSDLDDVVFNESDRLALEEIGVFTVSRLVQWSASQLASSLGASRVAVIQRGLREVGKSL